MASLSLNAITWRVKKLMLDREKKSVQHPNPDASSPTVNNDKTRKQTKQEGGAEKVEREKAARIAERKESMSNEGVDGGYLVTLGTYTGPEDFDKGTVRRLQIERRFAPFWRGLDDYLDSWQEHQLVAAARGEPVPPDYLTPTSWIHETPQIRPASRDESKTYTPYTASSLSSQDSPKGGSKQRRLFRFRLTMLRPTNNDSRKKLRSVNGSLEVRVIEEPYFDAVPIEACLYKNASECIICLLYYPPYLNTTTCCRQPICSECFVQIKRCCPFCVCAGFGVTYEPPPFRRGLIYAKPESGDKRSDLPSLTAFKSLAGTQARNAQFATSHVLENQTDSLTEFGPSVVTSDRIRPHLMQKLEINQPLVGGVNQRSL